MYPYVFHSYQNSGYAEKSNLNVLISLIHTFKNYQQPLFWAYWRVGKDWKEKELYIVLSSPFLLCHFQYTQLASIGYDAFSWLFMFLTTPFFSFCIRSKFYSELKVWPPRACFIHWRHTCFESCGPPMHLGSTRVLCSWAIANTTWKWAAKNSRSTYCTYHFCSHACSIAQ